MSLSRQERELTKHLAQYISDHRKGLVESVLNERTRYLTIVLEDIFQSQNASATVRTSECLGVQDIHIIENTSSYEVNRDVLKGSNKWMNLIRYKSPNTNNTETCFNQLKRNGYTIYATDPATDNISIDDIDVEESKVAFVFGNEHNGLSSYALTHADKKVRIPMFGFTESFNISVSVAICLSVLLPKVKQLNRKTGLTNNEKDELRLSWYRKMVRGSGIIEKEFMRTNP